ncbi:MAG: acyl--CoA ligase [Spirochaetales bacterium]|nr:acyl--CoA ligase [Spirochaetales bacterium]
MRSGQKYRLLDEGSSVPEYDIPFGNLYETLFATAYDFPDKIGLIDAERAITYHEFLWETDRFSSYLYNCLGIRKGDRVAMLMVNSIEFCVTFYAILKIGAIVVPINTKLSQDEVCFEVLDSGCRFVVSDSMWKDKFAPARESLSGVVYSDSGYLDALSRGNEFAQAAPVSCRDDVAVIMYTSGTTGRPKGACLTHWNLMQGFYSYAVADDMDGSETTVVAVPLFHITGLNNLMTLFVFLGGTMYLVPFFDSAKVLSLMTESKCSYFHAVATVYIMLAGAMDGHYDLSSLRDALCGGGFIPKESIERFCRYAPNCRFHPVYGMTETAGTGTYFRGHCQDYPKADSCGQPAANCSMRIVDDDGVELPPGKDGEICFKGPFIIDRYLGNREESTFSNGWMHSGDIGHFDTDGYLYITDRKKDMINRGGEKIFSLYVESVIMGYPGIRQACVFAVRDDKYMEVPGAVLIPESGASPDLGELREYLRKHMAHYKVPVYMEIRGEVPVTANGKPRKAELRRQFNEKYGSKH